MPLIRCVLVLLLAFAWGLWSFAESTPAHTNSAIVPEAPTWHHAIQRHRAHREQLATLSPRVVFIGDSITEQWETRGAEVWQEHFAALPAANLGVVGDRTQHVLWRLEDGVLDGVAPEAVVLLIGTNNIKEQRNTPEETAEGVRRVVRRLRQKAPHAAVVVVGVLPCGATSDAPQRRDAQRVNELLRPLAKTERVSFIEVWDKLLDPEGGLPLDVSPDSLHLSEKGYRLLARELAPAIAASLRTTRVAARRSAP